MLEIKDLSRAFPQRGQVLNGLNLLVREKESLAITGPSGSGKTTLLNLIALLDRPDGGSIIFRDRSILSFTSDEAADYRNLNIGFVYQEHLLLPHITLAENIRIPLLAGRLSDTEIKEKYEYGLELMAETGISDLRNKYPSQVSGGEAQRTALVRALVNKPSLLLADEPTGALDAANSAKLSELITKLGQVHGLTVIVATHSEMLAAAMSRRLRLENGRLA